MTNNEQEEPSEQVDVEQLDWTVNTELAEARREMALLRYEHLVERAELREQLDASERGSPAVERDVTP